MKPEAIKLSKWENIKYFWVPTGRENLEKVRNQIKNFLGLEKVWN